MNDALGHSAGTGRPAGTTWPSMPIWAVASCNDDVLPESTPPETLISYVEISDVEAGRGITNSTEIEFADAPSRARRCVRDGDVLVSTVRTYLKAIAPVVSPPANMVASTGFAVLRPRRVQPRFLAYAVQSEQFVSEVIARSVGVSYPAIGPSALIKIGVLFPPQDEQVAIAAFLDREMAKIDALVGEQRRLIELLKEKRQAVISQAVTKGLDPNAKMKPSGVEWLGDVPAHWTVASIGTRYVVQLGKMLDGAKITGEHLRPYLRVMDVQWGAINTSDLPEMDFDEDDRARYRLQPGDLLVNEGGSYVGRSAVWNGQLDECYYQKALHRLRPLNLDADAAEFFYYVMTFATELGVFVAGGNQNTIDHLPAEKLRRYRFAFPPRSEQSNIASYLQERDAGATGLINECEHAVALLVERRSALISAAVTGKIDVRSSSPAVDLASSAATESGALTERPNQRVEA